LHLLYRLTLMNLLYLKHLIVHPVPKNLLNQLIQKNLSYLMNHYYHLNLRHPLCHLILKILK